MYIDHNSKVDMYLSSLWIHDKSVNSGKRIVAMQLSWPSQQLWPWSLYASLSELHCQFELQVPVWDRGIGAGEPKICFPLEYLTYVYTHMPNEEVLASDTNGHFVFT